MLRQLLIRNSLVVLFKILLMSRILSQVEGLNNGLALRPPMGFNTWERYRCTTDCSHYVDDCLNDRLIMKIADVMSSKYLEFGYEYLVIDDCWLAKTRDVNGDLREDPKRFKMGMKSLVKYVHSKGLKFGIYGNYGTATCAGYPGIKDDIQRDVNLFAIQWEVDFVKLDGCFSNPRDKAIGYPEFGRYLNQTDRPIVYSCSWPSYLVQEGVEPNYTALIETCNLWRNYEDVEDSWASVLDIMDYYANKQHVLRRVHGPGHWHDADMLIIGNFGLSYEQSKSQMALWCVMGMPLFISTDLTKIRSEFEKILLNKKAIAINQDPMGIMGIRISVQRRIHVWRKPVLPTHTTYNSYAIAILNTRVDGSPKIVRKSMKDLGLYYPNGYLVEDVFSDASYVIKGLHKFAVKIPPSGVKFLRFTVLTDDVNRNYTVKEIKPVESYLVNLLCVSYALIVASIMILSALCIRTRHLKKIIYCIKTPR